jgi:hypothetical protein
MYQMHGIQGISQAEGKIEENNFGIEHPNGWNERRYSGDHGQFESLFAAIEQRSEGFGGVTITTFCQQDPKFFLSHTLALFPKRNAVGGCEQPVKSTVARRANTASGLERAVE